ncbi:MAG TPA: hypothetical protein VMK12_07290 [Anaeromyxobacteraceae bacterium]|nr:hypothetical protein [Anaeromyxobacteraceae bacterium]
MKKCKKWNRTRGPPAIGQEGERRAQSFWGKTIKTEKFSRRAFQRCLGRSAQVRAAGTLIAELKRKAKACGGAVIEFAVRPHEGMRT